MHRIRFGFIKKRKNPYVKKRNRTKFVSMYRSSTSSNNRLHKLVQYLQLVSNFFRFLKPISDSVARLFLSVYVTTCLLLLHDSRRNREMYRNVTSFILPTSAKKTQLFACLQWIIVWSSFCKFVLTQATKHDIIPSFIPKERQQYRCKDKVHV
jgi:hypothetical protein